MTETRDNATAIARWAAMPNDAIDAHQFDGDFAKRHLINDQLLSLLGELGDRTVLDAGAGDGYLSRMLARRGARVTAVEPAQALVDRIRELERSEPLGIEIHQVDLADFSPADRYDAVVCSMVLQAVPDWRPALRTCVESLRPGGRLVITLNHPAFEHLWTVWKQHGSYRTDRYLREYEYSVTHASDFHRPLSTYLNAIIEAGCRMERMIEPGLDPAIAEESGIEGIDAYVDLPNFVIISAVRG